MYKIFLAWQSQKRETASYIKKLLKSAKEELQKDGVEVELIFSPTQDEAGSPDIKETIWRQIRGCDVFVGDLSFIGDEICNGNVLYETGIADAFLGDDRVILLCDENTSIEKIPFDINHKRISKVNVSRGKDNIAEWIRSAIIASDNTRFVKTFATNQYIDDLIIVFNYFYKFINIDVVKYSKVEIPSIDEIIKRLNPSYPYFMLNVDFSPIISEFEDKLLRVNQFEHKRVIWYLMNVITKLGDYQKFCSQMRYAHINTIDKTKQYNVYDIRNFYLKNPQDFSSDTKTVLFSANSELVIGKTGTIILDKRIFRMSEGNIRREYIPMDVGVQEVIVSKDAIICDDSKEMIANLVRNILVAIKEYFNYNDLSIELETEAILTVKDKAQ